MAKTQDDINDLAAEQGGLVDLANKLSGPAEYINKDGFLYEVKDSDKPDLGPIQSGSGVGKGGSPLFAGKMTGGGGFSTTDFGGDFTRAMIAGGVSPSIYGLPGEARDYAPGGKFNVGGKSSLSPGGYQSTGETGQLGGEDAVFVTGKRLDPIDVKFDKLVSDPSMSGMGLTPDMSTFVNPGDQPTYMSAAVDSVKSFLGRLAQVHPATRNAAFAMGFVKNLREAENPQEFVKGVLGQLAMRKVGGKLGLSGMQKQGIGGLMNMAQGKQNLAQTVGGLANSAAFRAAAPNILRSVYKDHGMNGVYLALTALGMGKEAAGKGIYGALATPSGPGGGG